MLNLKDIGKALKQVAEEKGLTPEQVLEAIETAIAAAYKREYCERGAIVKCKFDLKTGELKFWQVKTVVDETTVRFVEEKTEEELQKEAEKAKQAEKEGKPAATTKPKPEPENPDEPKLPRYNPDRHILLEEAKKISAEGGPASAGKKDVKPDEEIT